jgi:hypothetical protein
MLSPKPWSIGTIKVYSGSGAYSVYGIIKLIIISPAWMG